MRRFDTVLMFGVVLLLAGYAIFSQKTETADKLLGESAIGQVLHVPAVAAVVDAFGIAGTSLKNIGVSQSRILSGVAVNSAVAAKNMVNCSQSAAEHSLTSIRSSFENQARNVYASIMETKRSAGYAPGTTIYIMADDECLRR